MSRQALVMVRVTGVESFGLSVSVVLLARSMLELLGRCDLQRALALCVLLGALDALDDRGLVGVVRAVELPRVRVVAVVGDLEAVVTGPHEAADGVLGEEERGARLGDAHRGDLHARGHADDALAVLGGRDRTGHVRAVGADVPPGARTGVGLAVGAGRGVRSVEVRGQVLVLVVHTGVQDADLDGGGTGGDGPGLVGLDLGHVGADRLARRRRGLRRVGGQRRVVGVRRDVRGAGGADLLDAAHAAQGGGEGTGRGVGDDHADRVVVLEHRAAVGGDGAPHRRGVTGSGDHEVGAGTGNPGRTLGSRGRSLGGRRGGGGRGAVGRDGGGAA